MSLSRPEQSNSAAGSTVNAGGNVTISATGSGNASNIVIQGSRISAGNNATLIADGQVKLLAAQNTTEQHSTNSSSSASVGVGINFGSQSGISFNASASKGNGSAQGSDTSWTNTHVTAGNTVVVQSGGDTTLKGAVIAANTVKANIGGNLNLESLQDTSTYTSQQKNTGAGVSVCVPPLCYGTSSVSGNASKANVTGDYASVVEQSGIKAGDGGFQINVKGNTDLKGAVISSTQTAIDAGRNTLTTATLTQSDIQNRDNYKASGYSIGATLSGSIGDQKSAVTDAQKAAASSTTNAKPGGSAGIGSASGSQNSTTLSGISGGTITITNGAQQQALTGKSADETIASVKRDVTTGQDTTGAINKAWSGSQLMTDVQAQTQITAAFGSTAATQWGQYANEQQKNAKTAEDAACWGANGACRVAGHTVIGGLTGGVAGAVGTGVSTALTPIIAKAITDAGVTGAAANALTTAIAAGIGAAAGGAAGAAGAYNEVRNNYLTSAQWEKLSAERAKCENQTCLDQINQRYAQLSAQQDQELRVACTDLNSGACRSLVAVAVAGSSTQERLVTTGALPDNYLRGADFNSNVNLFVQKVQAQDVVNACNANPAQCDQARLVGSARLLLTGVSIAAVVAVAPALATEAAAMAAMGGPMQYCAARPQSCLTLLNAAAEAASGVPVSGVNVPTGAGRVTNAGRTGVNGGVVAGELSGTRTAISAADDAATIRSLTRENESATTLANNGYNVQQNPPTLPNGKNPDYIVNGQVFDNYAPSTSSVRNAAGVIEGKVAGGQAENVVVNLADSSITPSALRDQLTNYPIPGLKQVIIIDKSGTPTVIKFEGK